MWCGRAQSGVVKCWSSIVRTNELSKSVIKRKRHSKKPNESNQANYFDQWLSPTNPPAGSQAKATPNVNKPARHDADNFSGLQLVFLGTSSSSATQSRNVSSIAVKLEKEIWLFDCGEATQTQIRRTSKISQTKISSIFITHMHGDHLYGLPSLMCAVSHTPHPSRETRQIFGPNGIRNYLRSSLYYARAQPHVPYQINQICTKDKDRERLEGDPMQTIRREVLGQDINFSDAGPFTIFENENWLVHSARIDHTVPCFGYVLEEKPKPPSIDAEKCMNLGLPPSPLYKQLKMGKDIQLPDGRVIFSSEVLKPSLLKPRKIVILGDTCNPRALAPAAMDCDVLVHEATLLPAFEKVAYKRKHATSVMAARFAREVNAKNLVLTHFSPGVSADMITNTMIPAAIKEFGSPNVFEAKDFLELSVHTRVGGVDISLDYGSPESITPEDYEEEDDDDADPESPYSLANFNFPFTKQK